jgi:hypothetical protein
MNGIDKLKSRTEWQAYLLTVVTLFLNHFLGWDMNADTLYAIVGSTSAYGISRGMAKGSADPDASAQGAGESAGEEAGE